MQWYALSAQPISPEVERDGRGRAVVPAIHVLLYSAAKRPYRQGDARRRDHGGLRSDHAGEDLRSIGAGSPLGYHVYLERERSRRLCAPYGVSPGAVGMCCCMAAPFRMHSQRITDGKGLDVRAGPFGPPSRVAAPGSMSAGVCLRAGGAAVGRPPRPCHPRRAAASPKGG